MSNTGFTLTSLHTSGHATISDITKVINALDAKKIVSIHTLNPEVASTLSKDVVRLEDGEEYEV